MPDLKNYKTDAQFYKGSCEQVMLNYTTAKHMVKYWYTEDKLEKLINDLDSGKSFDEAFGQ